VRRLNLNSEGEEEDKTVYRLRPKRNVFGVDESLELIPIDHSYCLPPQLRIECYDWFWFSYPQVKRPVCPEIIEYMESLDFDKLLRSLTQEVMISKDSIFLLVLVHHLLVRCLRSGLTLLDVAQIVARSDEFTPSPLEKVIEEAENNAFAILEAHSGNVISFNSKLTF